MKAKIPDKIYFETLDDFLFYTKRRKDYETVHSRFTSFKTICPIYVNGEQLTYPSYSITLRY